jgi:hypothetical protein
VEWSLAIVALTLLGVAAVSGRLSGTPVTPAIVFVAVGLLVGPKVLGEIDLESSSGTVRTLAEATLALVLFCDASRIDLRLLRRDIGVPLRLLGIGLPLTIALGALAAAVLLDRLSIEEAVILAIGVRPRTQRGPARRSLCTLVRATPAGEGPTDGERPNRCDTNPRTSRQRQPRYRERLTGRSAVAPTEESPERAEASSPRQAPAPGSRRAPPRRAPRRG